MNTKHSTFLLLCTILLASCATTPLPTGTVPDGAIRCLEPRPEICAEIYSPVQDDKNQTHGNGCYACASGAQWHIPISIEQPQEEQPPTNEAYVECTEPRPEICTREYMPVCAVRDNGVRCITTPCDSTETQTYGNKCDACADKEVYGYTVGECKQEIPPPQQKLRAPMMVCNNEQSTATAEQFGFECVQTCPEGYDQYGSQIGLTCVEHSGEEEILSWPTCTTSATCHSEAQCVFATQTTDAKEIPWKTEEAGFRCALNSYVNYLLHTVGATTIDENGEKITAIA